jgi:hypothetical protein
MVWIGSRNKIIRKRPGKEKPKITGKKKKRKYSRGQNRPRRIGTSGEIRRAASSTVNLDR